MENSRAEPYQTPPADSGGPYLLDLYHQVLLPYQRFEAERYNVQSLFQASEDATDARIARLVGDVWPLTSIAQQTFWLVHAPFPMHWMLHQDELKVMRERYAEFLESCDRILAAPKELGVVTKDVEWQVLLLKLQAFWDRTPWILFGRQSLWGFYIALVLPLPIAFLLKINANREGLALEKSEQSE